LKRFFTSGSTPDLDVRLARKLGRLISVLNTAQAADDMRAPAHRLHPLRGDRQGQWAV
jgi:proteic killer suppression protein